ncbi:MAG: NTP transferase domain-containing protein, partial [Bdellovibrionales bacterium]|nr:NTP transferase domain-containing protein [Bdellovibrionales bacterium]
MKALIIIPARYGSSRFPGKPLALLAGKPMLLHVIEHAQQCQARLAGTVEIFIGVATDDERIRSFCEAREIPVCMTSPALPTGTDRALAAIDVFQESGDVVVSLQGDNPLVPPQVIQAVIEAFQNDHSCDVATPVIRLSWEGLDSFRNAKIDSPFSGTTCLRAANGQAFWFSKMVLPAIRNEARLRAEGNLS